MKTLVTVIGVLAMVGCENIVSIGDGARGLPAGVPARPSQEDLARMATTFSGDAVPPSESDDARLASLERQNTDARANGEQTEQARATIARAAAAVARNAELLGAANE